MATLTAARPTRTGVVEALVAASVGGDQFKYSGNETLIVVNASGSSRDITIPAQKACNYGVSHAAHNTVVTVATGTRVEIRPGSPDLFADTNGYAQVTYSSNVGLTVGVKAR